MSRGILKDAEDANKKTDEEAENPLLKQTSLPKRFYENVEVKEVDAEQSAGVASDLSMPNFAILLDGRSVKTPARKNLILPSSNLAELAADEFRIQKDVVNPALMPVVRLINTVIDGIADDIQPVVEDILRYMSCDMVFYRADSPEKLVKRQSENWDKALDWAFEVMGAEFEIGTGVMFHAQKPEALAAAKAYLRHWTQPQNVKTPFAVAALHLMTSLAGSALLACMVEAGALSVKEAWKLAHVEEDWTIEQWGEDEKAMENRASRERDFYAAAAVLTALKDEK